ncbi:MAG: TetR/AcrR family transcriptional regulator [Spirochaetota bacterium]|nr:TetR/AcrR family transcriptional regulator [Spirochaetota bacterium]
MGTKERRQHEREALRRLILDTASQIMINEGIENLTIRRLARSIEYSPRTIYLYYRDKKSLLEAIVEEGFAHTLHMRSQEAPARYSSLRELMEVRIRAHVDTAFRNPNFYRAVIYLIQATGLTAGPNQRQLTVMTAQEMSTFIPSLKDDDELANKTAKIIMAAVRGFTIEQLNSADRRSGSERQEMIDRFIDIILKGLENITGDDV